MTIILVSQLPVVRCEHVRTLNFRNTNLVPTQFMEEITEEVDTAIEMDVDVDVSTEGEE